MITQKSNEFYPEDIEEYLDYLEKFCSNELQKATKGDPEKSFSEHLKSIEKPDAEKHNNPLSKLIRGEAFQDKAFHKALSDEALIVLLLALVPHFRPGFFDRIIHESNLSPQKALAIGLTLLDNNSTLFPTLGTALFFLGGDSLNEKCKVLPVFSNEHVFKRKEILWIETPERNLPHLTGRLILNPAYVEFFLTGHLPSPNLSIDFPAQRLDTPLTWKDLVLTPETEKKIEQLRLWIRHHEKIASFDTLSRHIKPGYRALFTGPPGTGKTLTATLIGQEEQREVYRIDLSLVVSKFIGETEKNLSTLFDKARHINWILLFDEADALFGQRTSVRDAHDKYANQEIAYLLQRMEDHPGVVILTSNLPGNIDKAFVRRFDIIAHFPLPGPRERLKIWQNTLPKHGKKRLLAKDIDLERIAESYELSGSSIINVIKSCALQCVGKTPFEITLEILLEGIKNELRKEGRVV